MFNIRPELYLELFKKLPKDAKVAIYGSNKTALAIKKELEKLNVDIKFFINSFANGELDNLPIYKATDLDKYKNEIDTVILASVSNALLLECVVEKYKIKNVIKISQDLLVSSVDLSQKLLQDMEKTKELLDTAEDKILYECLVKSRFKKIKIWQIYKILDENVNHCNNVYLDYINKDEIKTVISAGAHNGINSIIFSKEFKNVEKIYAFEPIYDSVKNELYDYLIKVNNKIEIVKKAFWDNEEELEFVNDYTHNITSSISQVKSTCRPKNLIKIKATTIDNFVENNKLVPDYIKMDIENAEIQALKGAEKTLKKYRPQLAICIYHSLEQFSGIAIYLDSILKDYVYRLGHYSATISDTVLYAIPREKYSG